MDTLSSYVWDDAGHSDMWDDDAEWVWIQGVREEKERIDEPQTRYESA